MSIHTDRRKLNGWILLVLAALLLWGIFMFMGACALVPKHMRVDTGLHPKGQDRDVRFRTTYYFRVFDYCADNPAAASTTKKGSTTGVIKTPFAIDSLYRFRMTGKANSLTTSVNFESGTLTAGQIDPFGATVAFDKKNRQFYFKTQSQVQREAARESQFKELDRLVIKYGELKEMLLLKHKALLGGADKQFLLNFHAAFENQRSLILPNCAGGCALTFQELDHLANKYRELRELHHLKIQLKDDDSKFLDNFLSAIRNESARVTGAPDSQLTFQVADQLVDRYQRLRIIVVSKPKTQLSLEDQKLLGSFRELIVNQIALINGMPGGMPTVAELDQLVQTIKSLKSELESTSLEDKTKAGLLKRLNKFITDAINLQLNLYGQQATRLSQPSSSSSSSSSNYCQNLRRGFQILGPEGWRTFNQDERLIMAMTAKGEPLIATMQELSGRVLDNQPVEAELFLPLIEEELQITRSEGALDKFSPDEPGDVVTILENAVHVFKRQTAEEDTK